MTGMFCMYDYRQMCTGKILIGVTAITARRSRLPSVCKVELLHFEVSNKDGSGWMQGGDNDHSVAQMMCLQVSVVQQPV